LNTADLFESFACKAMQTAKETDEPRERVLLLKLALDWTAVAQRSRNEAAPPPAVPLRPRRSVKLGRHADGKHDGDHHPHRPN
jgi:hypothetical protein